MSKVVNPLVTRNDRTDAAYNCDCYCSVAETITIRENHGHGCRGIPVVVLASLVIRQTMTPIIM